MPIKAIPIPIPIPAFAPTGKFDFDILWMLEAGGVLPENDGRVISFKFKTLDICQWKPWQCSLHAE
jgi:hypothetical protein